MNLPEERIGPYVRALYAALDALAPDEAWVPLSAALDHLHALDPAVSGGLLFPAEVVPRTGMPDYTWLQRAASEAILARETHPADDPTDAQIERVRSMDADLADRMQCRRSTHQHLRRAELLPTTAVDGAVRRLDPTVDVHVKYDRMAPDGRWERIRFDLRTDPGTVPEGTRLVKDGRVRVDEALQHLLTRHHATPLLALRAQLHDATGAEVTMLSRAWLGPFWWPGIALPEGVPAALGEGLVLHASREVVGHEVRSSGHLDPWYPPPRGEERPEGCGLFRERRLAVSAPLMVAARGWFEKAGMRGTVVPIGRPRQRRL